MSDDPFGDFLEAAKEDDLLYLLINSDDEVANMRVGFKPHADSKARMIVVPAIFLSEEDALEVMWEITRGRNGLLRCKKVSSEIAFVTPEEGPKDAT